MSHLPELGARERRAVAGPRAATCVTAMYYDELRAVSVHRRPGRADARADPGKRLEGGLCRKDPTAAGPAGAVPARLAAAPVQAGDFALRRVEAGRIVAVKEIVHASVILIALAAAGCSYFPDRSSSSTSRGVDTLCMNDCLGSSA